MTRILHIIPHFYPAIAYGGTPRVAYELVSRLVREGEEVTVVTTDAYEAGRRMPPRKSRLQFTGFKVHYFPNISNFLAFNYKLSTPWDMYSWLKKHLAEYELVHLHEFRTIPNLLAVLAAGPYPGLPILLQPHGTFINYGPTHRSKAVFDFLFFRKLLARINRWIAVSPQERDDLISAGLPAEVITTLPNGVNVPPSRLGPLPESLPKNYVLFLGRLDYMKGLEICLAAFSRLRQSFPDLKFVIAGSGTDSYLRRLHRLAEQLGISPSVVWFGPASSDVKYQLLHSARFSWYYCSREAFGLVPLESITALTPVLISDRVGCADYVLKSGGGLVIPFSLSPSALIAASGQILEHRPSSSQLVHAKAFLLKTLSWDRIAGEYQSLYRQLI